MNPLNTENTPARSGNSSRGNGNSRVGHESTTSVAPAVNIASMTPRAQAIWLEAFELGRTEGWVAGWDAHEAHEVARWQWIGQQVGRPSQGVPFDVLSERRGEHDRAAAHRALLVERGIA